MMARAIRAVQAFDQPSLLDLGDVPRVGVDGLRAHVRAHATNAIGVYTMRGPRGDVLYVGKSRQLRTRLLSYFRLPWPEHRHARMLRETASITWEETGHEFAALLRETRLIRAHRPRYNVRGNRPLDRWWVITVEPGVAPRLRVQRASAVLRPRASDRAARMPLIIGPFAQRAPLTAAVRVLSDALGLRDCSERVPLVLRDAGDLFADDERLARTPACHRYETRRCLGPCVAACSGAEYRTQLDRATSYLRGDDDAPRAVLVREMAAASASLAFERAGWLRDRLATLETLDEQLAHVREALHRPSFVYAPPADAGPDRAYLVRDGRVVADASTDDDDAMARLKTLDVRPWPPATALTADALEEMATVDQWFRTRPAEQAFVRDRL